MNSKKDTIVGIFEETEDYIRKLDPKKCSPPFIMNVFSSVRAKAFQRLEVKKPSNGDATTNLKAFITKFEVEYIDELKAKLKPIYVDYIQQKKYNIPSEVNLKELKTLGADSEVSELSIAVAEWSLELEILAYTIEGIKLYGLQEYQGVEKKDYIGTLKYGYTYHKKTNFHSMGEYVVRRAVNFTIRRCSNLALMRGLTKIRFGVGAMVEIFFAFTMNNRVPWTIILGYLNLPWVVGGLVCSILLSKLNDSIIKDEALSNLKEVYMTFENNKLYLMNERNTIVELMIKITSKGADEKCNLEMKKLSKVIESLLNPKEEMLHSTELPSDEIDKMYDVKDEGDYVIVEDKDHKEKVDKSGVLIVDWQ